MNYAPLLLKYLQNAPEEIQKKCDVYYENPDIENRKINTNRSECVFNGLIFRENYIGVYNILIYSKKNWEAPFYLNVYETFEKLLKYYNVYHAAIIIKKVLRKYERDNVLLENNYLHFKYYDGKYLQKLNYNATKHRNREGKFLNCHRNRIEKVWDNILYNTCIKEDYINSFGRFRRQRPNTMFFDFGKRLLQDNFQNGNRTPI